ncbi:MAG TPA: FecR family protein [Cyclobacteriaceae bacterium]|nr:FecR family protein [Cyclobacteriaceae bacterium]
MPALDPEERYRELAEKWLNGSITAEEQEEFSRWYNSGQDKAVHIPDGFAKSDGELKHRIFSKIKKKISRDRPPKSQLRWGYAAAVLMCTGLACLVYYFTFLSKGNERSVIGLSQPGIHPESVDIVPEDNNFTSAMEAGNPIGRGEARLTLADGKKVLLDRTEKSVFYTQGNWQVVTTADGNMAFVDLGKDEFQKQTQHRAGKFNTVETGKGRKLRVSFPDGTKVWLNANSSLRFPIDFNWDKRQVTLSGEAYFEVARDEGRKFEILAGDQRVQVLGTHFNINAYANEPSVNTTLLEGIIKISNLRDKHSHILKPGERALLSEELEIVQIDNAGDAVAWKEGYFKFHEADIQTVMRQIERWYDVVVKYEGGIPDQKFGGEMEKSLSLMQVLKILEKTNVRFRLEGREVTVLS